MKWNDDELTAAYRRSVVRDGTTAAACPDEAVLERFLLGTLEPAERHRLADHLEVCGACAALLRELELLAAWAERAAAARRSGAGRRVVVRRALAALAAVVVLALGGSLILTRVDGPPPPAGDVSRGTARDVSPPPGAAVAAAPAAFDWPDEAGAAAYRLRLFGPRADLLWESGRLTDSACPLPAAVAESLAAGGLYSWTVQVEGPVQRRELGPFGFEIAPR